jgi:ABC-2 type transport system permease protein
MSGLGAALQCEVLKARRSKVPLWTALGLALAPLMGGLFMVILKDPERARAAGLIGAKAQITAGTADWPTYLGVVSQALAVGGSMVFAFVAAWVFGREFAEGTLKLLLAVPTRRGATVAAKFLVVWGWSGLLAVWVFALALGVGALVELPGWSARVALDAAGVAAVTAALAAALVTPTAFLASAGRGYLAPLGFAALTLFLAQVAAATGWGGWFPWSVPPLWSGLAGPRSGHLGAASYALVGLTSLGGLVATAAWWRLADHGN